MTVKDAESSYRNILKKTAGKWKGEDWEETRKKRSKIELKASKKNKRAW